MKVFSVEEDILEARFNHWESGRSDSGEDEAQNMFNASDLSAVRYSGQDEASLLPFRNLLPELKKSAARLEHLAVHYHTHVAVQQVATKIMSRPLGIPFTSGHGLNVGSHIASGEYVCPSCVQLLRHRGSPRDRWRSLHVNTRQKRGLSTGPQSIHTDDQSSGLKSFRYTQDKQQVRRTVGRPSLSMC